MAWNPGTKIGSFEIIAPLGAGGMGEVYRALDTRLKREVAIKVLPEAATWDRDRLARFDREAQLLASLNHPNIGAIYGVEEAGESRCLILELIEGETLAERIGKGALSVSEALATALQIAEALEAAHDRGIVHRDLKPANVKVTPDGTVKVLDFGLAKAAGNESSGSGDISLSPTLTAAATQAGVILGTAAYMSPEQAAGQPVDRRADVWAFGVVLLEMLTGRKTFGGETVSHTLASVLKEDPAWDRLPADLPPRIRALLQRCLEKKLRRRLQSIGEARVVLEDYRDDPESFALPAAETPAAIAAPARRGGVIPWAAAAIAGLAVIAAPWWAPAWFGSGTAPAGPVRLSLAMPAGESLFRGYGSSVVISPDGTRVTYVTEQGESRRLYVHYLDQWEGSVILEGPSSSTGPYNPFWSPDGQWIGYVTRTELKKVPVRGGSPITLCSVDRNRGATWGPDGTIVFARTPGSPLFRVPASGGEPEAITALDEEAGESTHRWPQFLPGGRAILFTSLGDQDDFGAARIEVVDLANGERRVIHSGGSYARYVPSGHVVYHYQGTLFAFPFDADSLTVTGSVAPVVERVGGEKAQGGAHYSVSEAGTLAYASGGEGGASTTVVRVNSKGEATHLWTTPQEYGSLAMAPDGSRLAAEVDSEGNTDIWVFDLARQVPTRLTFAEGDDESPVWSPDGAFLYFSSERDGAAAIYRTASDGSGEPELVRREEKGVYPVSVSPDGRSLSYLQDLTSHADLWILPLEGGDPVIFASGPAIEYGARWSPDGRWILYGSNESGAFEVYVRPASGGRGKWQISRNGGAYPRWTPDGSGIYYRTLGSGSVNFVAVESSGDAFRAGAIETLFTGPYLIRGDGTNHFDVIRDGGFAMVRTGVESRETHEHLHLVIGWLTDLRATFDLVGTTPR